MTKSFQSLPVYRQRDVHILSLGANITNSKFFATRAAPEINTGTKEIDQSNKSEVVMHSVNLLVQRSGRVLLSDCVGEFIQFTIS